MLLAQSPNQKSHIADIRKKRPASVCPVCGEMIGALAGSRDAVCKNCGYKEPCCG